MLSCGKHQTKILDSGNLADMIRDISPCHQARMTAVGCVQIRTLTNWYHVHGATRGHTIGVPMQWDPEGPAHHTSRY